MNVVIVGAGPAGATAARAMARGGILVTLLDRSAFPRNKPCGGAISLRTLRRFPHLERDLARIPTHLLSRLHLEGPDGEASLIESEGPAALMIRRVEFDNLLVSLAVDAGAHLVTGADVVQASESAEGVHLTTRDGRRFDADIVVAADGAHSVVARRLGLNPGWSARAVALDMMEETPRHVMRDVDPSTLWVAYGFDPACGQAGSGGKGRAAEGYAYVFPKRDHVNVGIGYLLEHYREHIDRPPYELQRGFIEHLRRRGVIEGESARANFTPFIIPVGGLLPRVARGRVLLTGDAGGFVNGVTAEGIYYAMVSGDLAAQAVAGASSVGSIAAAYARSCAREVGAELRDFAWLQRYLFADRRRIHAVVEGARREPVITKALLDFAVGKISYGALRRRLVRLSPGLAVRLLREAIKSDLWPAGPTRSPSLPM